MNPYVLAALAIAFVSGAVVCWLAQWGLDWLKGIETRRYHKTVARNTDIATIAGRCDNCHAVLLRIIAHFGSEAKEAKEIAESLAAIMQAEAMNRALLREIVANQRPASTNWREDLPATPPPEVSA